MTQYVFVDDSICSGQKKRTFEPEDLAAFLPTPNYYDYQIYTKRLS